MSGNAKRLENDYRSLFRVFEFEPLIEIKPLDKAPHSKYRIKYNVPSLRLSASGTPMRVNQTIVDLTLPAGYPKVAPVAQVAAGDVVFHPNFNASKICLMDHWSPSIQLVDLVREIGYLLQWTKYNIQSPLNAEAAQWSQSHLEELPLATNTFDGGGELPEVSFQS